MSPNGAAITPRINQRKRLRPFCPALHPAAAINRTAAELSYREATAVVQWGGAKGFMLTACQPRMFEDVARDQLVS